jgi:hypothetical protein
MDGSKLGGDLLSQPDPLQQCNNRGTPRASAWRQPFAGQALMQPFSLCACQHTHVSRCSQSREATSLQRVGPHFNSSVIHLDCSRPSPPASPATPPHYCIGLLRVWNAPAVGPARDVTTRTLLLPVVGGSVTRVHARRPPLADRAPGDRAPSEP